MLRGQVKSGIPDWVERSENESKIQGSDEIKCSIASFTIYPYNHEML